MSLLTTTNRTFQRVPSRWWRRVGIILLVLWLSYSIARLLWLLLLTPNTLSVSGSPVNLPLLSQQQSAQVVDIEAFAQLNPFGKSAEAVEVVDVDPSIENEAQETRLQLELQGVIATGDVREDRAIIANGSSQQLYAIGDALPGAANVKLSKVLADRVVIENNGRYELLWLYDEKDRAKPQPKQEKPRRQTATLSRDVAQRFASADNLNVKSLGDVVKLSLKRVGGEVIGFEVRPGRDRAVFDNMGLRAGDVVTAVNGTKLTDQATAVEIAKTMQNAKQATLSILRNDELSDLEVSLE